ncbi:MAG: hypothetical protein AAFZ92_07750 [Pseudomonadota bacterium]
MTLSRLCLLLSLCLLPLSAMASLEAAILQMLDDADQDVEANRLMTPAHDNAFDRYRAVLLLDNDNQRAQLGLSAIAKRYLAIADAHMGRGQLSAARRMLANAVKANGNTAETAQFEQALQQAISAARTRAKPLSLPAEPVANIDDLNTTTFALNKADLSQRNQSMVGQLAAIGQRVQGSREYVLIYARSDAEGRWIYQQLRNASTGYRVRGNIKRSKHPRVILEAPLN